MKAIKVITGIFAVLVISSALMGLATGISSAAIGAESTSATETTKERGYVIECTGIYRGQDVWVSVYENNTFANVLQVVVGDNGTGASREDEDGFVDQREVRGSLRLQGKRLTVLGTAKRVGPRTPVHEEHDDAGQHIVEDGYHRALRTDLSMKWMGRTIALDCDNAFFYKLTVTKTDTTND